MISANFWWVILVWVSHNQITSVLLFPSKTIFGWNLFLASSYMANFVIHQFDNNKIVQFITITITSSKVTNTTSCVNVKFTAHIFDNLSTLYRQHESTLLFRSKSKQKHNTHTKTIWTLNSDNCNCGILVAKKKIEIWFGWNEREMYFFFHKAVRYRDIAQFEWQITKTRIIDMSSTLLLLFFHAYN